MRTVGGSIGMRGVVLLVIGLLIALPLDEAVHDLVFRYVVSHEVRLLANGFTVLGTAAAGTGVLAALAVVGYRTADGVLWRASLGGLAGLAIGGLATEAVKQVACRARPRLVDGWGVGPAVLPPDPALHGFFHWPCLRKWSYRSFPSGHATTAFTLVTVLSAIAPGRRRLWLGVGAGVAASRVLLNAHFVSDVLGGALIGWWGGEAGQWLVARVAARLPGPRPAPAVAPSSVPRAAAPPPVTTSRRA